jgi:hypothetical protein
LLLELKTAIERMNNTKDKLTSQCMAVLACALENGPDVDRLTRASGYPGEFVQSIAHRMRQAGLWNGHSVDDREWWDADGNLRWGLFAHALVAQGKYIREPVEGGGCRYVCSETGNIGGEWRPDDC